MGFSWLRPVYRGRDRRNRAQILPILQGDGRIANGMAGDRSRLEHGKHSGRNSRGVIHRKRACWLAASRRRANRQGGRRLGTAGIMQDAGQPIPGSQMRAGLAAALGVLLAALFGAPAAKAAEMSSAIAYLY